MWLGIDTYIFPTKKMRDVDSYLWKHTPLDLDQMPNFDNYIDKKKWVYNVARHNIKIVQRNLKYCVKKSKYKVGLYRLPNNLIPGFLYRPTSWYIQDHLEDIKPLLFEIGEYARQNKIRLTFHAPMTVVLNSINQYVVSNSIFTLNKLVWLYQSMGFDTTRFHSHGITICLHVGGKQGGIENFKAVLRTLSKDVLNLIAVENDDKLYSVEDLVLADLPIPIIADLHHNWCLTGEYIEPKSMLYKQVKDSWDSITPIIHASMPRYECCKWYYGDVKVNQLDCWTDLPDREALMSKCTLQNLRPHSKTIYSYAFKHYLSTFLKYSDIMIEAQNCNLATTSLGKWIVRGKNGK